MCPLAETVPDMRRFIRHPSDIPIQIRWNARRGTQSEPLTNISAGGLSFHTADFIAAGTAIDVSVPIGDRHFNAGGTVVWCRPEDDGYTVGIEFTGSGDSFKMRMVEQICHIEHYKREIKRLQGRDLSGEEAANEWIARYADGFPPLAGSGD
jgi:hypothetical protein